MRVRVRIKLSRSDGDPKTRTLEYALDGGTPRFDVCEGLDLVAVDNQESPGTVAEFWRGLSQVLSSIRRQGSAQLWCRIAADWPSGHRPRRTGRRGQCRAVRPIDPGVFKDLLALESKAAFAGDFTHPLQAYLNALARSSPRPRLSMLDWIARRSTQVSTAETMPRQRLRRPHVLKLRGLLEKKPPAGDRQRHALSLAGRAQGVLAGS